MCYSVLLFQANMIFNGNKARVGPVMFVSNLAACEWYSLNPSEYFEENNTKRWENILHIRLVAFIESLQHITCYSIPYMVILEGITFHR